MLRRHFLTATAATLLCWPANATEDPPVFTVQATAEQIDEMLSGNTIRGTWGKTTYSQYFSEDGVTIYIEKDRPPSRGKWRVKPETDQYDSWWEQTGWTAYTVMVTDQGFAWVNGNTLEFFTIEEGRQISW